MRPTTRILLVADAPATVHALQSQLSRWDYQITGVAESAETAIALTQTLSPNLVLIDLNFQGGHSGREIADLIRSESGIPVVFLSTHADQETLEEVQATYPFGYLREPLSETEVRSTIEIALSKHQAERAIQKALERERELEQLKSQFIGLVSHEFRTPLSILLVSLDMLEHYPQEMGRDKQQRYFQQARSALEQLQEMLADILLMNEATTHKLRCQPVPLDLAKFCQTVIQELPPIAAQHSVISIQIHTAPASSPKPFSESTSVNAPNSPKSYALDHALDNAAENTLVWLDPKLVRHILSHLLSNAIKFSPAGSEVTLKLSQQSDHVLFQVQDHGIGIPIADQANLFHLFYRASNVGQVQGTGLGLAIVKQCLEAHGGHIFFESQPGVGSTFTVRIPNCLPTQIEGITA